MADILSTLRELRSLEEKRAHGTLSPEEEVRFQELQNAVSSRGPKPGPPSPKPIAASATSPAPVAVAAVAPAASASVASIEEAPFVDAELTEELTEVRSEPASSEATVAQAVPATPTSMPDPAERSTAVAPAPSAPLDAPGDTPVPMSAAELRQWNASFDAPGQAPGDASGQASEPRVESMPQPVPDLMVEEAPPGGSPGGSQELFSPETPGAEPAPSVFAAPPAEPAPPAAEWLAPTPLPLTAEPAPEASPEGSPEGSPEDSPEDSIEPVPEPSDSMGAEAMLDIAPEPTVIADDSPMVWSPPGFPASATEGLATDPAHDDGWTASVSWSSGIPSPAGAAPESIGDNEPTRLAPASAAMDPFAADAYEPAPDRVGASSAEVSTKKYTPIGEAFAAGESRVVVHTLGGVQKRGTLVDAHMNADFLELRLQNGEREMLSTAALKAVFFVVPIGQEVPKPVGDPVTVTLQDGHQLSGLSPDYQVGAVGFFLCPTDQRSRTAKIYIYAGSVKAIS